MKRVKKVYLEVRQKISSTTNGCRLYNLGHLRAKVKKNEEGLANRITRYKALEMSKMELYSKRYNQNTKSYIKIK